MKVLRKIVVFVLRTPKNGYVLRKISECNTCVSVGVKESRFYQLSR